ncbi:branched-chain amino acid ABC transporter permease [Thermanaerosceptrum fracticalcis]|uniref:Branched-chain amino acid ABC transporter permease n=1 Tax=Thermanaerosceptrum fracticalcis TaxID=1712410 RepID=A0A7G6E2W2_THEFR|nr:branched-chain amino acid ABC transporter permease [Thermanaerosceptrum fracticalcis]QNB46416.1 branched-chain amino acid ABC transporter permease [Thermanaerosceptrum fracticalcis]
MWYYVQGVLALAMINVISVVGLAVFTGFTGLFSLGHAAFIAIGAYTAAISTYFYEVNFYVALLLGGLMAGLVSLIIGYPTLKAKLRSDYFAIATLGFGEAVRVILENLDITQGARGLPGIKVYSTFPVVLIVTLIVIYVARNFVFSRYGRMAIAVREDFTAAEMMGINLFKVRLRSLFFSAVCAGVGGGLFAHYISFIQPSMFTGVQSTMLTAAVVAGGMGSITGPIAAALIFAAIPEVLRVANMWRLVAYGFILVAIMVLRPQGIFGYKELSWKTFSGLVRKTSRAKGGAA